MLPNNWTTDNAMFLSLKILLLFLAAISHLVGLAAPNSPPPKERIYKGQPFEKVVRLLAYMSQATVTLCLMSESAVILSLYSPGPYSQHVLASLCPGSRPSLANLGTLTPSFVFGLSVMLFSSALRVWCYVTLGSIFTFEVTFHKIPHLVTSGPYAYARHPSYTAILFMLVGAAVTCLASGSYVKECHIMSTPAGWWVYVFYTLSTFATISLWRRGRVEDDGLRKAFGERWERYRQEVPWMFVPGLF